ncbi:hypothetical protein [Nitrospirillum amazonense]|uniref:Type IV pilus biogenesis protein PilP n=1 Tax=Nitrospirillum amazonense TaxID=28077 RepID=A0A560KI68_9PROT|nr:hypothetical protein [Nitrospirillum amazonense]MDG3444479.1 hypothetical protein [Nitrospirillum amazonense]TWB82917.1 hypothetical protein FBZ87_101629 [Nitrospirillum amazonense]
MSFKKMPSLTAATLLLALAVAPAAPQPARAAESLASCRAIGDATQRLACYDALAAAAANAPAAPLPNAATANATPTAPAVPEDPTARFGKEKLPRTEEQQAKDDAEQDEEMHSTVASSVALPYRLFAVTLANGQTWVSKEALTFDPKPGDEVRVMHGLFGSYSMVVGRSRPAKATRVS